MSLKGLVNVRIYSKRFTRIHQLLALIVNCCEFNANSGKWSGVRLSGDRLANFKHSSDFVHAYYADGLRLLCTDCSSPMANNTYTTEVIAGAISERSRMWFSPIFTRCLKNRFYIFGGTGSTFAKCDPEEDFWSSMPNKKSATTVHHLHLQQQNLPIRWKFPCNRILHPRD